MTTFTIEMLPACEGDCLLLSYKDASEDRWRRVLIDGGRASTYATLKKRLTEIPEDERELELFVVTHIDRDHIEGALKLLEDEHCPVTFRDIWFNGYHHLDDESFGAVQGERLTEELLKDGRSWNGDFSRSQIRIPDAGLDPAIPLAGGLTLTVLSPTMGTLRALRPVWEKECKKAGIVPSEVLPADPAEEEEHFGAIDVDALADDRFHSDGAQANGSSIALLAEYGGRRVLLGADAHVPVLLEALARLQPAGRVRLDAFKVPHHGSAKNLSAELLGRIDCARYLVSTNGSYFDHPTRSAIARILKYGGAHSKELVFNYRSEFTEIWEDEDLAKQWAYVATFPDGDNGNVTIEV